jgi:hypothetical protein
VASAQKPVHPSIFLTNGRIENVKQRISKDKLTEEGWNAVKENADQLMQRWDIKQMTYLAMAYRMTGEKKYSERIREMLLRHAEDKSWGNSEMLARRPAWNSELQIASRAYNCAVAFDAVYDDLTSAERKNIAKGLERLALVPLLGDWTNEPTRIHSLNSMGHNWWTSCACMGGILAMSLRNEIPECKEYVETVAEALPQWFDFAGDVLQNKSKTFDDNGGMYESLNYASFGISEALLFAVAYKDINPLKGKELIQSIRPHLELLPTYFISVCYPRTGEMWSLNFGDSHKNITGNSCMILLNELGIRSDNTLWYLASQQQGQHREGMYLDTPNGLLFTPVFSGATHLPNLPKSYMLNDFGWVMMRTSWEKNSTLVAMKSGATWNHAHADANTISIFHKGTDILKDAGNCSYSKPEYRNYFFQSQAHNVVLVDGEGQPRSQQYHGALMPGSVHHLLDGGNIRYALANGTGPMSHKLSRNFRHLLWIDNVVYVIDDLKSHEQAEFQWLWHPGGEAKKRGFDITVTKDSSSVVIRPLLPRPLANSDYVHDYPNDLWWEFIDAPCEDLKSTEQYMSFHLPGKTDKVKALTAIILKDTPQQTELPTTEIREGKDWTGIRVKNGSRITDIYINQLADGRLMHLNSWIEADGWTTDAYLLAVTYEEGTDPADAKEMFIGYGSALRRESTSYFSSFSKLFVIRKDNGRDTEIIMDGQPSMTAHFKADKHPASLVLNGKKSSYIYRDKKMTVSNK